MRTKLNRIVILDFLFVVFLFASALAAGTLSSLLYAAAFLIPIAVGCFLLLSEKSTPNIQLLPNSEQSRKLLSLSVPLAAPTLMLICLFAWLTSFLLGLTGKTNTAELTGVLWKDLLFSALVPAVGEEILFRYLPLRLLASEDQRHALFFSSLFFAMIHCNLFQIPYAFVAGILFALLDLLSDSILPSVVLHLLNNAVSIFWIHTGSTLALPIYLGTLGILSVLSVILIWNNKVNYRSRMQEIFAKKSKLIFSLSAVSLILVLLYVALASFFG